MSFGLARGRDLDDAPGVIGVARDQLPPLPDDILTNPEGGFRDPRAWFGHPDRRLEIEIGCGKGGFILQEAAANPMTNYLGMEHAREFYMYAADRVRRRGLTNTRMLCADAVEFMRWRCPSAIASVIHLYFSDPWPKTRHHKNRVVQHAFLADAWRILLPGGELRVVTDHDELWAWDEAHFALWTTPGAELPGGLRERFALPAQPYERHAFTAPEWAEEGELVGTNYERKFRREDRPAHACVLRKRPA